MNIIEYEDKYLEDVKDLLVELEEYIISIDMDQLDQLHPDYRDKMAVLDLEEVSNNNGKCYIAVEEDKAIGVIMGIVGKYDEYDYLDYKCPKRGIVTELVVSKNIRSSGIGQQLMNKMEEYFKSIGCEYILIDVFGYNDNALKFYYKQGYHARMLTTIKKI
jgi:ribosomal protein S18 acetylase RimI-like enzyme